MSETRAPPSSFVPQLEKEWALAHNMMGRLSNLDLLVIFSQQLVSGQMSDIKSCLIGRFKQYFSLQRVVVLQDFGDHLVIINV